MKKVLVDMIVILIVNKKKTTVIAFIISMTAMDIINITDNILSH